MSTEVAQRNTETTVDVPRMVIVMKNGLTFWVTKETGERAQAHLEKQSAHSFMRIAELGETINTAEISGIHSPGVYDELKRVEAGEFKCQWGKWHGKKQICECKAEAERKRREELQRIRDAEENKPLTPEQKAANAEGFRKSNELYVLDKPDSIFRSQYVAGSRSGKKIRRSTILEWEEKTGQEANIEGLAIDEDVI